MRSELDAASGVVRRARERPAFGSRRLLKSSFDVRAARAAGAARVRAGLLAGPSVLVPTDSEDLFLPVNLTASETLQRFEDVNHHRLRVIRF